MAKVFSCISLPFISYVFLWVLGFTTNYLLQLLLPESMMDSFVFRQGTRLGYTFFVTYYLPIISIAMLVFYVPFSLMISRGLIAARLLTFMFIGAIAHFLPSVIFALPISGMTLQAFIGAISGTIFWWISSKFK